MTIKIKMKIKIKIKMSSHLFPSPTQRAPLEPPPLPNGPQWGPSPFPPKALREGGEEGVAEGLALMREQRLPPPECLSRWWERENNNKNDMR